MEMLTGRRRFEVRPHAARINRTFQPFRASSGKGFSVRRSGRMNWAMRLSFWTVCTLAALWSFAIVAGAQPGAGPPQAVAASVCEGTVCGAPAPAQYRW